MKFSISKNQGWKLTSTKFKMLYATLRTILKDKGKYLKETKCARSLQTTLTQKGKLYSINQKS